MCSDQDEPRYNTYSTIYNAYDRPAITEAELARKALRILRLLAGLVHWTEVHLARNFCIYGRHTPYRKALPLIWQGDPGISRLSGRHEIGSLLARSPFGGRKRVDNSPWQRRQLFAGGSRNQFP